MANNSVYHAPAAYDHPTGDHWSQGSQGTSYVDAQVRISNIFLFCYLLSRNAVGSLGSVLGLPTPANSRSKHNFWKGTDIRLT
jgi:hypothetical protein